MHRRRTLPLLLTTAALTLLAGCTPHTKPLAVIPAASEDQLKQIRAGYESADPMARVGRVIAVLPQDHLAAVGDVPVADFHDGDVITFIDANQNILTAGAVVAKTTDAVHVRYQPAAKDKRDPVVGDLAVKLAPNKT